MCPDIHEHLGEVQSLRHPDSLASKRREAMQVSTNWFQFWPTKNGLVFAAENKIKWDPKRSKSMSRGFQNCMNHSLSVPSTENTSAQTQLYYIVRLELCQQIGFTFGLQRMVSFLQQRIKSNGTQKRSKPMSKGFQNCIKHSAKCPRY